MSDATETLSPSLADLVKDAKALYQRHYAGGTSNADALISVAPGRVNLIGEHTDYTGGFVLPLAIDYSTVVYGTATIKRESSTTTCRLVSTKSPDTVKECTLTLDSKPPPADAPSSWTGYVLGVVAHYLPDLPKNTSFDLSLAISGNVPLGGGLSSSASLEVAVARFLEAVLGEHSFSSDTDGSSSPSKTRALRCQKAENTWCHSPCGIMDQYVSSAASEGTLLLIDCTSFEYQEVKMATLDNPVLVVTNSNVSHDIAGGEYPIRVAQCKTATAALQSVNDSIKTLRDATIGDVENAKSVMDDVTFRRARHVVTENARTLEAKDALEVGDWKQVGSLMNASHASMRDDYEVRLVLPCNC